MMGMDQAAMAAMQQAAAAAAAAGGSGDTASVAESGSASDSGMHVHGASAAAMQRSGSIHPLMMPGAAAAAAETPSTVGPQQGLPTPVFAGVDAAADSAAAAAACGEAAVTIGDGGDGDGDQRLVCQVPGCGKDLAGLKDYHQRYRICDTHIKLPQVREGGIAGGAFAQVQACHRSQKQRGTESEHWCCVVCATSATIAPYSMLQQCQMA
jgi:hypothetical protein